VIDLQIRNEFLDLVTPDAMWTRFEQLCSERSDLRTLSYIFETRHKALEWIHSVGVCMDAELQSCMPPLPPPELRERVGPREPEEFLRTGLVDLATIFEIYMRHSDAANTDHIALLDFGCGCGRLLRFLEHTTRSWRAVGSDVNAALVGWCQEHLRRTEVRVNGVMPPLDHADGSFDLVYSLSIFTHLNERAARAWLSELGRVLHSGGLLILTTHGIRALETIRDSSVHQHMFGMDPERVEQLLASFDEKRYIFERYDTSLLRTVNAGEDYGSTFIHPTYAHECWNNDKFELCEYVPAGLRGWQDIAVIRRR
jgi:SAM-dependent methyltransferase